LEEGEIIYRVGDGTVAEFLLAVYSNHCAISNGLATTCNANFEGSAPHCGKGKSYVVGDGTVRHGVAEFL